MVKTKRLKDDERLLIDAVAHGETIVSAAKRLKISDDRRNYIVREHGIRELPDAKEVDESGDEYV